MFEILGENYYIDLGKINDSVTFNDLSGETQIAVVKYETIKLMVELVCSEVENIDEKMRMKSTELSIPFKLAFNTLLMHKIINKL
jgi:hypothetical protein